jgi:Glyoxalase/Bleomycin resistance protein/Dioxygenase superfamily/Pyridoxamine 5'-phosphate oxidase
VFTEAEIEYLRGQRHGHLATVGRDSQPHVVPVTFWLNLDEDTIDVGGRWDEQELEGLDHVGLTVADVSRSVRWYQEALGLRRAHQEAWGDFPAVLEANGTGVALSPTDAEDPPPPADSLRHVAFRTSRLRGHPRLKSEPPVTRYRSRRQPISAP